MQVIKDGKKVEIKYYEHGLLKFKVKFDKKTDRVYFTSKDGNVKFSLDRSDHDDCEYASLSLGILL